jgi:hypothetical protein
MFRFLGVELQNRMMQNHLEINDMKMQYIKICGTEDKAVTRGKFIALKCLY